MADLIFSILISFITIFIIMDPFPSLITFLTYTKKHTDKERSVCATKAVLIAGLVALLFLFLGPMLLDVLRITLSDFKVAGGLILTLLGIETVLGITMSNHKDNNLNDLAVLIATPLLTGPGLVTSLIVLSEDNGLVPTLIALLLALFVSWMILLYSIKIRKTIGEQTIHITAKIIGLVLLALGVSYIKKGLVG